MIKRENQSYYQSNSRNDYIYNEKNNYYINRRVSIDHSKIDKRDDYCELDIYNCDDYDEYLANEGYEEYLIAKNYKKHK